MERKIGEIFEYNGEWYQCVEGNCAYCSLKDEACEQRIINDVCKLNRIFKKLEKVGEPTVIRGKPHQKFNNFVFRDSRICQYCAFHHKLCDVKCEPYEFYLEIKQNKEDMEEKKNNYNGYMDKECIPICDALNSISDVHTTESCCGHCKDRFMVFFTCDNPHSLAIIARVFDGRYIGTSQPWYIELQTKDSGSYYYFIHSETKYSSEEVMMKDVNQIIENIKYWCDDKFASHFKGCDDKPTLAPFDINLAKQGKPVCTRDGRKARIICFDKRGEQPIVALIKDDEEEHIDTFFNNGHSVSKTNEVAGDLMMLPEKKEGWINVYKNQIHNTFKSAEEGHKGTTDYIKTIKVSWEE